MSHELNIAFRNITNRTEREGLKYKFLLYLIKLTDERV